MTAPALARSLPRRWQALRPRSRAGLVLLAVATLVGGWFLLRTLLDPWPARATLKTPGDTWPLAFSPDGRTFLTSGEGGITRWDVATGRRLGEPYTLEKVALDLELDEARDPKAAIGEFSPDGRTLAVVAITGQRTQSVVLIDAASRKARASWPVPFGSVQTLRFAPDGRALKTFLYNEGHLTNVIAWDAETGRELWRRPISMGVIAEISPDGSTLALASMKQSVVDLWDLDANRSLGSVMDPDSMAVVSWGSLALTADGRVLAVGREDGTIQVWDVPARKLLATLKGHSGGYASNWLRFSPDGRALASEAVLIRRSPVGQFLKDLRRQLGLSRSDEPRDTEVVVFEVATGRRLARCHDASQPTFSPDGRTVATRERDLTVKLRDVPETPR
jgi:WD40 repeat protein